MSISLFKLAILAEFRTLKTNLQALRSLTARIKEGKITINVAVEVLSRGFLEAHTATGTAVTAGVTGYMQAGGADLQEAKGELSTVTEETGQNQRNTAV